MVIGHIEIHSWRGISIGAVHWYAKLVIEDGDINNIKRIELKRKLLGKEAKALNKERLREGWAVGSFGYKAGQLTEGFNTEEDAIAAGTQKFKSEYWGVLFNGDHCCASAWKKVIVWPNTKRFNTIVAKMNELATQFQALNGYEGKERKLVEKLDNKWYKAYITLQKMCYDKSA